MTRTKNIKNRNYSYFEWLGLILIDISLWLACSFHFRHYWELMTVGFFLILYEIDRKFDIAPYYVRLYIVMLKAGLIGDLILGLGLHLWRYNFPQLWDYLVLYTVGYPLAGIVMVQVYVLLKAMSGRRKKRVHLLRLSTYRRLMVIFGTLSILLLYIISRYYVYEVVATFYLTISLFAMILLSYVTRLRQHDTLLEELHDDPLKMLLILACTTYFFAFVYEVSNSIAHEWVYASFSVVHSQLLGFPIIILPFWTLAALIPVAVYYYMIPMRLTKTSSTTKTRKYRPSLNPLNNLPRHASRYQ